MMIRRRCEFCGEFVRLEEAMRWSLAVKPAFVNMQAVFGKYVPYDDEPYYWHIRVDCPACRGPTHVAVDTPLAAA